MKISNHINNSLNFGSIYKYNVDSKNYDNSIAATGILSDQAMFDMENYQVNSAFVPFPELQKTGIYEKVTVNVDDKYDEMVESVLKQKNIQFVKSPKLSKESALNPENIYKRLVLPKYTPHKKLISLNTEKIDELFKETPNFYISPNGEQGAISNRYQRVKDYFATGKDIEAPEIYLSERNGKLCLDFQDGRHRYSVMRDLGLKRIKFAVDTDTLKNAFKYGLIAD